MAKLYKVKNKKTGKVFEHDYTNSLELVNNGYFVWAGQETAYTGAPDLNSEDSDAEDSGNEEPTTSEPEEPVVTEPNGDEPDVNEDDLEDMDREELIKLAEENDIEIDKRMGKAGLIKAIVESADAT